MNARIEEPCVFLAWDSEFFGQRIGRVSGGTLSQEGLRKIEAWARAKAVRCLYFLACPDDDLTVSLAESAGFHLVDIRLEFVWKPGRSEAASPEPPACIRLGTPEDTEALVSIARGSYSLSRFCVDPHFGSARSQDLYCEWIRKSLRGFADAVLVADGPNGVQGFITCSCEADKGVIGLVGVAENARGLGVGSVLIQAAKAYFVRERACSEARVVTQARNVSAQRLYQKEGFRTASVGLWFHKWFEEEGHGDSGSHTNTL